MNTLFQKVIAVVGLAVSFGLASCQEGNLVSPDHPVASLIEATNAFDGGVESSFPKKYVLTKLGKDSLLYRNDGRLEYIAYDPKQILAHIAYAYTNGNGFSWISAKANTYSLKRSFMINPATGYCETTFIGYDNDEKWAHSYDAQGHIQKSFEMMGDQDVHFEYSFDAAGDMTKIVEFDADDKPKRKTELQYNQNMSDKYPLNRSWAPAFDSFQRIFGKPSKHLLKRAIITNLPSNEVQTDISYYYTLNPDGYVQSEKRCHTSSGAVISITPYLYKLVNIGVQPQ